MQLTQDEIYRQGLEALRDRRGRTGMIRFLQQFEKGHGDYTRERREWVDRLSLDDLRKLSGTGKARKGASAKRKRS